ncbi:type II toxin-antitoxin system HicB family antitoxin [Candidatus Peregrinibacteria bacterium]|nr:type II toxin-antitoxin system HicB family antitoxin [Candidatus Peregrinibacteria bacterium]
MKHCRLLNYNIVFVQEPEGGYTVKVPALSGCITYGKTLEEAKKMATDAIKVYRESLVEHGEGKNKGLCLSSV